MVRCECIRRENLQKIYNFYRKLGATALSKCVTGAQNRRNFFPSSIFRAHTLSAQQEPCDLMVKLEKHWRRFWHGFTTFQGEWRLKKYRKCQETSAATVKRRAVLFSDAIRQIITCTEHDMKLWSITGVSAWLLLSKKFKFFHGTETM